MYTVTVSCELSWVALVYKLPLLTRSHTSILDFLLLYLPFTIYGLDHILVFAIFKLWTCSNHTFVFVIRKCWIFSNHISLFVTQNLWICSNQIYIFVWLALWASTPLLLTATTYVNTTFSLLYFSLSLTHKHHRWNCHDKEKGRIIWCKKRWSNSRMVKIKVKIQGCGGGPKKTR